MDTGLFRLFEAAGRREAITDFLNNSSYDELIGIDLHENRFKVLAHTARKYVALLSDGSYQELFECMSEILVHPDDRKRFGSMMDPVSMRFRLQSSAIPGLVCEELRFRLLNENWCWVEAVLVEGGFCGLGDDEIRLYVYDIHSRKSRELGLDEVLLYSDSNRNELTGLLRKKPFIAEVEKLISDVSSEWCLIAIDIDNFKMFNEWYGHSAGDLLMAQIGAKIKEVYKKHGGAAGYFGQDDFCLLIPYDKEVIEHLYAVIAEMIAAHGNDTSFRPAFGVAMVDADCKAMDMIDRAFLAARAAKQGYRSRIRLFDPGMYSRQDAEYHILADFMRAMKKNEITFYLQPQCRASSGKIVGAEALARWILPDGSVVPPDRFIPVLEKHGLITDLDLYIWEIVCKWQWEWIGKGNTPLPVSVNVSTEDIMNVNLTETFLSLTEKYQLEHNLIKIEITESAFSQNAGVVKNTVHELRDAGFTVLMDDFGSGYSTLNMLKSLSVDVLKLDAMFMNMDETNSEKSIRIIESVTTMAKTIGLPIIVEGVENEEQKRFLQDMGCRYIQGYYYYRPMEPRRYEELIADLNNIDPSGIRFKSNQQFRLREILDNNVYSDTMLNNILGPCAFYSVRDDNVDIIRYNEQFYEAVNVPDFAERLESIQRFMPPRDIDRSHLMFKQAKQDRLNGAQGLLHFYRTDGSLSSFYMRFYYLRSEEDRDIFYGAVQDITRMATLEKRIMLLSRYSAETIIFLTRNPDGSTDCSVLFNALEKELGMNREQLENLLNSNEFLNSFVADNPMAMYEEIMEHIRASESFEVTIRAKDTEGRPLRLIAYGDYIIDDTDIMDYIITVRKTPVRAE